MPTISLTSFLKILAKGSPQKVQEYSKYLTPGGFDYYWPLKEAAHGLTVGGESFNDCEQPIQDISREFARKHNLDGLKSLHKWLQKNGVTEFFAGPANTCSSPGGYLTIRLEPEFGFIKNGQRRLVQLWKSQSANLTKTAAGVGIYLLESHLAGGEFSDCKAGIWI